MAVEHWWNGSDRGKLKYWERNLSQWHFVQHKSHIDWLGIEPGSPWWESTTGSLGHGTTLKT